ncbi:methylmalonyl-CoA mutase family protein [Ensifer canadensis]
MLRTHCQTSGVSLQEQDPYNNVIRTALRGAVGGARRHPVAAHQLRSTRRWRCRPSFSARIARNTQLILQHETGVTEGRRSAGGLLLRREPDQRAGGKGLGADRGGRRRWAA